MKGAIMESGTGSTELSSEWHSICCAQSRICRYTMKIYRDIVSI